MAHNGVNNKRREETHWVIVYTLGTSGRGDASFQVAQSLSSGTARTVLFLTTFLWLSCSHAPKTPQSPRGILEILLPFFPRASLTPVRIRSLSLSSCLAILNTTHPAPASISGTGTRHTASLVAFATSASQCGNTSSADPRRLPLPSPMPGTGPL
jgi:hypothetical protein